MNSSQNETLLVKLLQLTWQLSHWWEAQSGGPTWEKKWGRNVLEKDVCMWNRFNVRAYSLVIAAEKFSWRLSVICLSNKAIRTICICVHLSFLCLPVSHHYVHNSAILLFTLNKLQTLQSNHCCCKSGFFSWQKRQRWTKFPLVWSTLNLLICSQIILVHIFTQEFTQNAIWSHLNYTKSDFPHRLIVTQGICTFLRQWLILSH